MSYDKAIIAASPTVFWQFTKDGQRLRIWRNGRLVSDETTPIKLTPTK